MQIVRLKLEDGFLRIKHVNTLLPHERTITSYVESLSEQIKHDGILKDPVIVEQDTNVILDGAHRVEALKRNGIEYVACYTIPYSSQAVMLDRWARVIHLEPMLAKDFVLSLNLNKQVSIEEAYQMAESRNVVIFFEGKSFVKEFKDILEAYSFIGNIEQMCSFMKRKVSYIDESEIDLELERKNPVILGPKLRKIDVIQAAKNKKLFPPKTTRHIIDPRPVKIKLPLERLVDQVDIESVIRIKPRLYPPGTFYEGRKYKERLLFLID